MFLNMNGYKILKNTQITPIFNNYVYCCIAYTYYLTVVTTTNKVYTTYLVYHKSLLVLNYNNSFK